MLKNRGVGCTHQGVGVMGVLNLLCVEGAQLQLLLFPLLLLGGSLGIRPDIGDNIAASSEWKKDERHVEDTYIVCKKNKDSLHILVMEFVYSLPWGIIDKSIFQESAKHEKYAGPRPDINSLKCRFQ